MRLGSGFLATRRSQPMYGGTQRSCLAQDAAIGLLSGFRAGRAIVRPPPGRLPLIGVDAGASSCPSFFLADGGAAAWKSPQLLAAWRFPIVRRRRAAHYLQIKGCGPRRSRVTRAELQTPVGQVQGLQAPPRRRPVRLRWAGSDASGLQNQYSSTLLNWCRRIPGRGVTGRRYPPRAGSRGFVSGRI